MKLIVRHPWACCEWNSLDHSQDDTLLKQLLILRHRNKGSEVIDQVVLERQDGDLQTSGVIRVLTKTTRNGVREAGFTREGRKKQDRLWGVFQRSPNWRERIRLLFYFFCVTRCKLYPRRSGGSALWEMAISWEDVGYESLISYSPTYDHFFLDFF